MRNTINLSSYFGGSSSINMFGDNSNYNMIGNFNLSDYSAIKKGTYGKLLKAYYAEEKKNSPEKNSNSAPNIISSKINLSSDKNGLTAVRKEADQLKNAADALGKEDLWKKTEGKFDVDQITSALKDFTKEYNDALSQVAKTSSKEVTSSANYMTSMTKTMSNALGKIGINVASDGKLSINEDTLKNADFTQVKNLFSGNASYGAQISQKAASLSTSATMTASLYGQDGKYSGTANSIFNSFI